ncbi:MAG: hypothetical protein IK142_06315 [Clostridiales bacterium]|nr:hypothetical protein [Clostridiales bacterium]
MAEYQYNEQNQSQGNNGLCIAGFVVSLVSLLCCGLTSIIGLILSIIGVATSKGRKKGLGIAGIIISSIMTVLLIGGMIVNYSDLINQDYSDIEELEEWLDSLEEESGSGSSRRSSSNDEISDSDITSVDWIDEEDGSYLVFQRGHTFRYYMTADDLDDNYYEGSYELYVGDEAIEFISEDLEEFGVTEDEIEDLIEMNDEYTEENVVLLYLHYDCRMQNGVDTLSGLRDAPYCGFAITDDGELNLDLVNMNSANYYYFIPYED